MTSEDIAYQRLASQQIAGAGFREPASLVKWMVCIRAEDFNGAKWAIGNRVPGSTDKSVEQAFNQGLILRTHVLQPAWHFISPDDIRWMLALTAPKLKAFNKGLYRTMGIDDAVLKKSKRIVVKAIEGGQVTRLQLLASLKRNNIHADDIRLELLLMDAELDGLICSGGREGSQFTYALLEDRAPMMSRRGKEESIAELTRRYFLSRGPATIYDFAGWSGLRLPDIKAGLEMNRGWLDHEAINGQVYWFDASVKPVSRNPSLYLLSAFDELMAAYAGNSVFKPFVILDGQVSGTWARVPGKDRVSVEVITRDGQDAALKAAIRLAAGKYGDFLGRRLIMG